MRALKDPLNCVCANLRRSARQVTRLYDAALVPSGLNTGQFTTLNILDRTGGMNVSELAAMLDLERTALTRNLRVLEKDKLILRETGEDRRERRITLTEAGAARLRDALPRWKEAQSAMVTSLGETGTQTLLEQLNSFG